MNTTYSLIVGACVLLAAPVSAEQAAADFDQGVSVPAALETVRERAAEPAANKALAAAEGVTIAADFIPAGLWGRCSAMGLENGQCVYACRDGRRFLIPPAPGMEHMGSRACLQTIDAPPTSSGGSTAAPSKPEPETPAAACERRCYDGYRARVDLCYELFDNPAGLRPCLREAGFGLSVCTKSCRKP